MGGGLYDPLPCGFLPFTKKFLIFPYSLLRMPLWEKNPKIQFHPRAEYFWDTQYKPLLKLFLDIYIIKDLLPNIVSLNDACVHYAKAICQFISFHAKFIFLKIYLFYFLC